MVWPLSKRQWGSPGNRTRCPPSRRAWQPPARGCLRVRGSGASRKKWFKCAEAADGSGRWAGRPDGDPCGPGGMQVNLQMRQEAAKAADNALARDPKNRRVIRAKARILWKLGRSKEAIALLRKYSSLAKSWSEPWLDMARVQASIGDWKGARAVGQRSDQAQCGGRGGQGRSPSTHASPSRTMRACSVTHPPWPDSNPL